MDRPLRIAQVSPLFESVPPAMYGGTERIVAYLTEELVAAGHEVTLYASADSSTSARLVPMCEQALRLNGQSGDPDGCTARMVERVVAEAADYDVLHFHIDREHLPFLGDLPTPALTTLHGRLDLPELVPLFARYPSTGVVSISDSQRAPLPGLNWLGTVYHGLPVAESEPSYEPGGYLAFLGRISPEKGVDRSIEIARRSGLPLWIAAKVDPVDRDYYREHVRPLLSAPGVEFIGEIDEVEKDDFLGNAAGLVFPIDWPEPFGLVMIEAMARATPVLAFRRGSVPEVIDDGVSGVLVENVDDAVRAVQRLLDMPRSGVRGAFERRFSAERMAADYVRLYRRLRADRTASHAQAASAVGLGVSDFDATRATSFAIPHNPSRADAHDQGPASERDEPIPSDERTPRDQPTPARGSGSG